MSTQPNVLKQPGPEVLGRLYKSIYAPVDNSPHSNQAVARAMQLCKAFGASLTGCHVYAAKMHDYRFKQMEYTLPEEYLQEQELERQRKIHDSLITMGLELISDCYLENMEADCQKQEIDFARRTMDGKHSEELLKDLEGNDYDLTILGALGIGRVKDSVVGSVCERVTRYSPSDVWVVKHVPEKGEEERDTILVGIDGSPQSFGALRTAIDLARQFGKKIELISVYDPYLHYAVFKGIVNVLTEKASKVFRFEEQNQLHEEIIDTGLAQIYQSHLQVAESMARSQGVEATTTLLDGKAFQKVLDHARKTHPWLIVVGRIGVHSQDDETALGSNSENLLRLSPCDILFTTRLEHPELDLKAEESIHWTPEAESRMTRVPDMVKNIARTAILRLAVEQGHSVVTSSLVTEAMERFMPKRTSATTTALAEQLALQRARAQSTSMCRKCGVVAKMASPVQCSVCGSTDFEVISQEMIEKIASMEGGVEEETTYDGRKVKWTQEARRTLYAIQDKYQMRRCKARIEKKARMSRLETITLEFTKGVIDEETGGPILTEKPVLPESTPGTESRAGESVVAVDRKGNQFVSDFSWEEEALERILRVPAGFMRDKTQERVEHLARESQVSRIDKSLVEDGLEIGRQMMAEMLGQYSSTDQPKAEAKDEDPVAAVKKGECPVPHEARNGDTVAKVLNGQSGPSKGVPNEAGWMSEMVKRRKNILD